MRIRDYSFRLMGYTSALSNSRSSTFRHVQYPSQYSHLFP